MSTQATAEQVRAAEAYEDFIVRYVFVEWAQDLVRRALPRAGERVLDVACGTGIVARTIAPLVGATGEIVGVDINPGMLAVARTRAPSGEPAIDWRQGDAAALPVPDQTFDLVLCEQGLQFFPDKAAALREMRRVLVRGGRVALSVWQSLQHNPVTAVLITAMVERFGAPAAAMPFSLGDAEDLRERLTGAGFDEVAIEPVTLTVRLPRAPFVQQAILGAAAVIPVLAQADQPTRARLLAEVEQETAPSLRQYTQGDDLVAPMAANVATARVG